MNEKLLERLDTELSKVGGRIREMRKARGWTLDELSRRTGLSSPYLSRVEAGERQPSLAALFAIAAAHGVSLPSLFGPIEEEPRGAAVVRSEEVSLREGNGLIYAPLSSGVGPDGERFSLQPLRVVVPASREGKELYRHEGEEWIYVLSGRLRLRFGEEDLVLSSGHAAHFDASQPHRLEALDGADAEVLVIASAVPRPLFSSYV